MRCSNLEKNMAEYNVTHSQLAKHFRTIMAYLHAGHLVNITEKQQVVARITLADGKSVPVSVQRKREAKGTLAPLAGSKPHSPYVKELDIGEPGSLEYQEKLAEVQKFAKWDAEAAKIQPMAPAFTPKQRYAQRRKAAEYAFGEEFDLEKFHAGYAAQFDEPLPTD